MTPEQGNEVLSILRSRDGLLTSAKLADGRAFRIMNIAWGRDDGADFDHITTNVSPSVVGFAVDFFHTSEVLSLTDEDGEELFRSNSGTPEPHGSATRSAQ